MLTFICTLIAFNAPPIDAVEAWDDADLALVFVAGGSKPGEAIDIELRRVGVITGASRSQIADLKAKLAPAIAAATEQSDQRECIESGGVPSDLATALAEALEQLELSAEATQKYKADLALRRAFLHRMVAAEFVQRVHRLVGLRSEQLPAMQKLAETLAKQDKIRRSLATRGLTPGVIASVAELLDTKQREFWKRNQGTSKPRRATIQSAPNREKLSTELLRELRGIANARAYWIATEFKLDQKQARKLAIAGKGGAKRAIEEWLSAGQKVYEEFMAGRFNLDTPEMQLLKTDVASLMTRNGRFRRLALSVLNKEQQQAYLAFENQRLIAGRNAYAMDVAFGLVRTLPLTAKELSDVHELVLKTLPPIDPDQADVSYRGIGRVLALTDDELTGCVHETRRAEFKATLKLTRGCIGALTDLVRTQRLRAGG